MCKIHFFYNVPAHDVHIKYIIYHSHTVLTHTITKSKNISIYVWTASILFSISMTALTKSHLTSGNNFINLKIMINNTVNQHYSWAQRYIHYKLSKFNIQTCSQPTFIRYSLFLYYNKVQCGVTRILPDKAAAQLIRRYSLEENLSWRTYGELICCPVEKDTNCTCDRKNQNKKRIAKSVFLCLLCGWGKSRCSQGRSSRVNGVGSREWFHIRVCDAIATDLLHICTLELLLFYVLK